LTKKSNTVSKPAALFSCPDGSLVLSSQIQYSETTLEFERRQDRSLFASLAAVMLGFGILIVHSASITSWPTEFERVYLSRHAIFLAIGMCAAVVCYLLPIRFWMKASPWMFLATVILLAAVIIPGIGTRVNGAQRWLRFGPISVQPAELAKITLPMFIATIMTRRRKHLHRWLKGTIPVVLPIIIVLPLVLKQPDLGTALFLITIGALTLFLGGWPIRNFIISAGLAVPAFAYLFTMKSYQVARITGFLAAWSDFDKAPYQLKQSLVTLGTGGLSGVGLGRGWQKLSFLPEANTDFVFAVVGEELGLIGTLGIVVLWAAIYYAGLRLMRSLHRQSFAYVVGITLLTQLVLQAALNVAVVTAMVPPKGIPHPLLSYGGSSLIVSIVSLGIVLGLSKSDKTDPSRLRL